MMLALAFILQGCLGIGGNSTPNGTTITTNSNGNQVSVVQNLFKGKIYFTIDHNLWVTDGKNNTREILAGGNISDPAVSPDDKWITVSMRFKNSSDIDFIPVSGGTRRTLLSGSGSFFNDSGFIKSSSHWFVQPTWSSDSTHVLFLSDIEKEDWYATTGINAPLLDLQVFSIPFNNALSKPQDVAYASFGMAETVTQVIDLTIPMKLCTRITHMMLQPIPSRLSSYFLRMPMPSQIILESIILDYQATTRV